MKSFGRILAGVALVVAAAGLASANSITYATSTPEPLTLTDWTTSLNFTPFDPSLGTLTSVELLLSSSLQTVLTVTNHLDASSNGTGNSRTEMAVALADSNLSASGLDFLSPKFFYTALTPGASVTSNLLTATSSSDQIYSLLAVLNEFTASSGTIALATSTFTTTVLSNTGGNVSADQVTSASLNGSVIYTYDAAPSTPEPATMALLGGALLGLGLFGKRLRKS